MPYGYEQLRDKFSNAMDYDDAQKKAAAIWNKNNPSKQVTGAHTTPRQHRPNPKDVEPPNPEEVQRRRRTWQHVNK